MTISPNIDDLLSCYNKSHPSYKFTYIFYNLSTNRNKPLDFPNDLWNTYVQKAPSDSHVPVMLKGFDELNERVKKQEELMKNINESSDHMNERVNSLKQQYKNIRFRIEELVVACRELNYHNDKYEASAMKDRIYKLKQKLRIRRDPLSFENKDEVEAVMWQFRALGMKLKDDIENYYINK